MKFEQQDVEREVGAALSRKRGFTAPTIRALLGARRLMGLAIGAAVAALRERPEPLADLYSKDY